MKFRLDESLKQIGLEKIFNISEKEYQPMIWFEEEIFANSLDDFFAKRPVDYTKHDKSITANDLF
jgi:ribonucleoside-diphosphate reductase beta chain